VAGAAERRQVIERRGEVVAAELAGYMGTSVEMIDRTYGQLAKGAEDSARVKFDAYASRGRLVEAIDLV